MGVDRHRGGTRPRDFRFVSDQVKWGLREYLVVGGTARITEGGAADLLQRLARIYIGPDVVFPAMPDPPPGCVTHVRVERIAGIGPWRASTAEDRELA